MDDKMRSFLEEGIRQYAEAKATVSAFEEAMLKELETAIKDREWLPMKYKGFRRDVDGSGGYGYWITLLVKGQSSSYGEVEIDCGLWWNSHAPGISQPIIYASYYYKPKKIMEFRRRGKENIHNFVYDGRTFLYIPLDRSAEIAKSLNQLLVALLKQLA